jgi:hypothetical protein
MILHSCRSNSAKNWAKNEESSTIRQIRLNYWKQNEGIKKRLHGFELLDEIEQKILVCATVP